MVLNIPHEVKTVAGYLIKLDSVESGKKSYDYFAGRYFMPKEQDHSYDGADVIVDESSMLTEEMFAAFAPKVFSTSAKAFSFSALNNL